jgi:Holliday junction resolvasome RuvABC endonuclease subunit
VHRVRARYALLPVQHALQPVQYTMQPVQHGLQPVQYAFNRFNIHSTSSTSNATSSIRIQPVQQTMQLVQYALQPVQQALQPVSETSSADLQAKSTTLENQRSGRHSNITASTRFHTANYHSHYFIDRHFLSAH